MGACWQEVLARLESRGDAEEYAYISSMAVREQDRRSGVASAMLSAAEQVAGENMNVPECVSSGNLKWLWLWCHCSYLLSGFRAQCSGGGLCQL